MGQSGLQSFYCMLTPQKRPSNCIRLFKGFSSVQSSPLKTPKTADSQAQCKITQLKLQSTPVKPSSREMGRSTYKRAAVRDENEQVVAEFKKMLHKSSIEERVHTSPTRSHSKSNAERQGMKDRLELKIKQAHQKLEEIKSTLKKYQEEKSEIVQKSDMRRSSLNGWKHCVRQPV